MNELAKETEIGADLLVHGNYLRFVTRVFEHQHHAPCLSIFPKSLLVDWESSEKQER